MENIGQAIRQARKAHHLTQAALAERMGMSRATLSGLENGTVQDLGIRKVIALCESLGLTLQAVARPRVSLPLPTESTLWHDDQTPSADLSPAEALNRYFTHKAAVAAGLPVAAYALVAPCTLQIEGAVPDLTGAFSLAAVPDLQTDPAASCDTETAARLLRQLLAADSVFDDMTCFFSLVVLCHAVRCATLAPARLLLVEAGSVDGYRLRVGPVLSCSALAEPAVLPAMALGGRREWADHRTLMQLARQSCQLPTGLARDVIDRVRVALQSCLPEMLRKAMTVPECADSLRLLKACWTAGLASLAPT